MIPTADAIKLIDDTHEDNENESLNFLKDDVTNSDSTIPVNITGVYIRDLQPDTRTEHGFNIFYCGENPEGKSTLTATTVHGQTRGKKSISGYGIHRYLYDTRVCSSTEANKIEEATNDIIGYDRLIKRKDCLVKGLPCEKCYFELHKFFEKLRDELKNNDQLAKDFYGSYVADGSYNEWNINTFTGYVKELEKEAKNVGGGKETDIMKERAKIINQGFIKCRACNGHIHIHDLFLTRTRKTKESISDCAQMCLGCIMKCLKSYVDTKSIKDTFKLAKKKGGEPKLCTSFMVPDGTIEGIDFLSLEELKAYKATLNEKSKTYILKIYDKSEEVKSIIEAFKEYKISGYYYDVDDYCNALKGNSNVKDESGTGDNGNVDDEGKEEQQKPKPQKATKGKTQLKRKTMKVK